MEKTKSFSPDFIMNGLLNAKPAKVKPAKAKQGKKKFEMIATITKWYSMTIEADDELEAMKLAKKAVSDDNYDAEYIKGFRYRDMNYRVRIK